MKESRRRAALREVPIFGEEILRSYDEKYLLVQTRYLEEYAPLDIADMIIDNNNWEYPVIEHMSYSE